MRRLLLLIAAATVLGAASAPAASAATYRRCGAIPSNGVLDLRSKNLSCAIARAVAQRTLDVKCFLNERSCVHGFRGRRWKCTVSKTYESVSCAAGNRTLRWRSPA
jgi:hypothetical protein